MHNVVLTQISTSESSYSDLLASKKTSCTATRMHKSRDETNLYAFAINHHESLVRHLILGQDVVNNDGNARCVF